MAAKSKALLAKMRFLEWLSTRDDLSVEDLRLAICLVSLASAQRGYAWPSLDQLAVALGRRRQHIHRTAGRLAAKGLFEVRRGGGRGRATEYRPCFDRVPAGNIYQLETLPAPVTIKDSETLPTVGTFEGVETFPTSTETFPSHALNVPRAGNPSEQEHPRKDNRSFSKASPNGDGPPIEEEFEVAKYLREIEAALKGNGRTLETDREKWWQTFEWLEAEASARDLGDPIGGWAGRLAGDVFHKMNES